MLIDFLVAFFGGAIAEAFLRSHGYSGGLLITFGLLVIFFFSWIGALVRLSKKESKAGLWTVLLIGLFLSFCVANIVSWFISSDKKEVEEKKVWCNVCHYKYPADFIVAESMKDGKVCRYCLDKKHKEKD
ncbi:MAG: hypothetical protein GBAus27B_000151 [Mycoplasmataceae bacterium]|nr:MAG: hypothetical protein GBAus27B_000151 [Mycoplasmataceae bacterium]